MAVGAERAIVAALTSHVEDDGVAEDACGALRNIACSVSGKQACLAAGAVAVIVAALKAHVGVACVTKCGIAVLKILKAT